MQGRDPERSEEKLIERRRRRRRRYSGNSKAGLVPHTISTGGVGKKILRSAGWERSDTIRSVGAPSGRRLLIEGHARHRLRLERDNSDTAGGVPRANAGSATNGYRKGANHYSQGRTRLDETAKRTLGAKLQLNFRWLYNRRTGRSAET